MLRPQYLVSQHRDQLWVRDFDFVRSRGYIEKGEVSILVGRGAQIEILDLDPHASQGTLLEPLQHHALEVHLGTDRHGLGHDSEIVAVGDLDRNGPAIDFGRLEYELASRGHCRCIEIGPGPFHDIHGAHLAVVADLDG